MIAEVGLVLLLTSGVAVGDGARAEGPAKTTAAPPPPPAKTTKASTAQTTSPPTPAPGAATTLSPPELISALQLKGFANMSVSFPQADLTCALVNQKSPAGQPVYVLKCSGAPDPAGMAYVCQEASSDVPAGPTTTTTSTTTSTTTAKTTTKPTTTTKPSPAPPANTTTAAPGNGTTPAAANTTTLLPPTTTTANHTGNVTTAPAPQSAGSSKTAMGVGLGILAVVVLLSLLIAGFVYKSGGFANAVEVIRHRGDRSFAFNSLTNES